MNQALVDYQSLAQDLGLGSFAETTIQTIETRVSNHAELLRQIAGFQPVQGWVTQQSRNHLFQTTVEWDLKDEHGYVLEAELVKPGCSLRVRGDGAGGWRLTHIAETHEAGAEPVLMEESQQLARGGKCLRYHVYWKHDDTFGWRTWAARLIAIEEEQS